MRILAPSLCAVLLAVPAPASAQLSNASIGVETGGSSPLTGSGPPAGRVALAATRWLEGDLDLVARVAWADARETSGRAAASLAGTLGLRWSILPDPIRPQVELDVGWTHRLGPDPRDGLAAALAIGVEWFFAPDLSLALRGGIGLGPELRAGGTLGASAYF